MGVADAVCTCKGAGWCKQCVARRKNDRGYHYGAPSHDVGSLDADGDDYENDYDYGRDAGVTPLAEEDDDVYFSDDGNTRRRRLCKFGTCKTCRTRMTRLKKDKGYHYGFSAADGGSRDDGGDDHDYDDYDYGADADATTPQAAEDDDDVYFSDGDNRRRRLF